MNAREGFRRIGLLLGIAGCIVGLGLSVSRDRDLVGQFHSARKFQILAGNYWRFMGKRPYYPNLPPSSRKPNPTGNPFEEYVTVVAVKDEQKDELLREGIEYVAITGTKIDYFKCADGAGAFPDFPSFGEWLFPVTFPILGFLVPWAIVRILVWVGSGFVKAT